METSAKLSPGTKTRYAYEVQAFANYAEDPFLERHSPSDLLQWNTALHDAGLGSNTILQKHAALRRFLTYLDDFEENEQSRRLLRALSDWRYRKTRCFRGLGTTGGHSGAEDTGSC